MKANFASKKAMFIAKRTEHLNQFVKMEGDYIKQLGLMVDNGADMVAEAMSMMTLGMRLGMNAMNKWGCGFDAEGRSSMETCTKMENPEEWIKANGKNINKDILKRMITVGIALEAAAKDTPFDPHQIMRRVLQTEEDKPWVTGDTNLDKWMDAMREMEAKDTDKMKYDYLKANPWMMKEVNFTAWRTAARTMIKAEMKKEYMLYHTQKLLAFKSQKECFVRLMEMHTTMQCASIDMDYKKFITTATDGKMTLNLNKNSL